MSKNKKNEDSTFVAKVVKVIDDLTIVINKGENHNIEIGNKFLVYRNGEEIIDPDTGENLGALEIVVGKAEVTHLQEKITTLKSISKKVQRTKHSPLMPLLGTSEVTEYEEIPFNNPQVGDLVKFI